MGEPRWPDFFIVGAPKCGTSAMHYYLRQHPEVFLPEQKDAHFFATDIQCDRYISDPDTYLALFGDAERAKRVGEASVWYLYSTEAARRIHSRCPNARIIAMFRNPVDMLYSQHSQFLYNANETIRDFEKALAAEPDRKAGRRIPRTAHFPEGLHYFETARFADQLSRYVDVFGWDRVHVILLDDLRADTPAVFRQTCCFLEVSDDADIDFRVVNPNKRVRSAFLRDLFHRLPTGLRAAIRSVVPDRFYLKYEKRPPMDPHLRARLVEELTPQIEKLEAMLDRDLSHWKEVS